MIRFSCDSCGTYLRAPLALAGKRGKCARCGTVNRVPVEMAQPARVEALPEPVTVAVKRAAEPSPFRSTADIAAPNAYLGCATPSAALALASSGSASAVAAPPAPTDFFDHVAGRISVGAASPVPALATAGASVGPVEADEDELGDLPPSREFAPGWTVDRRLIGVLVMGVVAGFLVGFLVGRM